MPIALQLLKAIREIHARGICHRDLKPDNIIIDGDQVTLIDFNVAVDVKLSEDGLIEGNTGLKEWSAPETRSNLKYDNQCDMWSVGCLLYFMYSGGENLFIMMSPNPEYIQ